jgi:predicted nucleic acid-binding protein
MSRATLGVFTVVPSWAGIAATAIARGQPAATRDNDYDEVPGWEVVKL